MHGGKRRKEAYRCDRTGILRGRQAGAACTCDGARRDPAGKDRDEKPRGSERAQIGDRIRRVRPRQGEDERDDTAEQQRRDAVARGAREANGQEHDERGGHDAEGGEERRCDAQTERQGLPRAGTQLHDEYDGKRGREPMKLHGSASRTAATNGSSPTRRMTGTARASKAGRP